MMQTVCQAARGYCACLRVLKDAGADLDVVDRKGYSALDWATVFSRQDCCEVLEGAARGRTGRELERAPEGCCGQLLRGLSGMFSP